VNIKIFIYGDYNEKAAFWFRKLPCLRAQMCPPIRWDFLEHWHNFGWPRLLMPPWTPRSQWEMKPHCIYVSLP